MEVCLYWISCLLSQGAMENSVVHSKWALMINSNAPRIPPGRPRRLNQVHGNSVDLFPNSLGLFPNSSTPRLALFPNSSAPRLALFPNSFTLFPNSFTLFPNSFGVIPELVCPYSRTPFPYSRTRLVLFLYPNSFGLIPELVDLNRPAAKWVRE